MENKDIEKQNLVADDQNNVQNSDEDNNSLIKKALIKSKMLKKRIIIGAISTAVAAALITSMIAVHNAKHNNSFGKDSGYTSENDNNKVEVKMTSEEGKNIENSSEYKEMLQSYKEVEKEYLDIGYVEVPTRGTDRHPMATNYYKDKWNISEEDIKNKTNIVSEFYSDNSVYILTLVTPGTINYPDSELPATPNPYKSQILYSLLRYNNIDSAEINDLVNLGETSKTGKQMAENAVKHDILLNKILAKYDYEILAENFSKTSALFPSAIGKNFESAADITISGYEDENMIIYAVFKTDTDGVVLYKCTRTLDSRDKFNLEWYDLPHYKIPQFNAAGSMKNYQDVQVIDKIKYSASLDATMHFDDGVCAILPNNQ